LEQHHRFLLQLQEVRRKPLAFAADAWSYGI
jgi:hypothetical protein